MRRSWTVGKCLDRACRLMVMADQAETYRDMLTYDRLAQEWLTVAAQLAGKSDGEAEEVLKPASRSLWRGFSNWFR